MGRRGSVFSTGARFFFAGLRFAFAVIFFFAGGFFFTEVFAGRGRASAGEGTLVARKAVTTAMSAARSTTFR